MLSQDEEYMRLAWLEAKKGMWRTAPNPCVGAVIVKNDKVVGKGYHHRAGGPHAEINAIAAAGRAAAGGTIYVTLEPCNHTGRTPPCTHAILAAGLSRVVIGMEDPNIQVAGGGAAWLAQRGVSVERGVLHEACQAINRPFIKHSTTGQPWVILKAGMSLDGRLAVASGQSKWITGEQSRRAAHRLRSQVDAILVGIGTVLADDPSLTARMPRGRDPLRVVLDSGLRTSPDAKMLRQQSTAETMIFCCEGAPAQRRIALEKSGARICVVPAVNGHVALRDVLLELGKRNCTSLLVEGGSQIHGAFLDQQLADEACFFLAPLLLGGDGLPFIGATGFSHVNQAYRLSQVTSRRLGDDVQIRGLVQGKKMQEE